MSTQKVSYMPVVGSAIVCGKYRCNKMKTVVRSVLSTFFFERILLEIVNLHNSSNNMSSIYP